MIPSLFRLRAVGFVRSATVGVFRSTAVYAPSLTAIGQTRGLRARRRQSPSAENEPLFPEPNVEDGQDDDDADPFAEQPDASKGRRKAAPSHGGQPDFLVGVAVRRHVAGYALLRFEDLMPLQFGIVDVRKALEVQQKALEINATLRALRTEAPLKLQRLASEGEVIEPASGGKWRWLVSIDDSTADRAPATTASQSASQRAIAMLQGLVTADARRLFKVAPVIAHPKLSRKQLGVRGRGLEARQEVYELAAGEVSDFPELRNNNGGLNEDTLLMSDAWASARLAQREALVKEKRTDARLMERLRRQVLQGKQMITLAEAVEELHPRKAGIELAEVLEKRVERQIEDHLHRLLDREQRRRTRALEKASARVDEAGDDE